MSKRKPTSKSRKSEPSVEQAICSTLAFMRRYLSHLCPKVFAPMHNRWDELVDEHKYNNFQAHRESAKSTILAIGYPLRRICAWLWLKRHQGQPEEDEHGAILGSNDDDAEARLRQIMQELEHNPKIKEDFRPEKGEMWADDGFVLSGVRDVKNPTCVASSLTAFAPGARLTFGILDDTTRPLNVESRMQRDKQSYALEQIVEPALRHDGTLIGIHTTYHNDDLPARLSKDPRYHSEKWPLVIDEERKIVQWPEMWSWARVQEVMKKPLVYARQYQLKEVLDTDRLLPMPKFWQARTLEFRGGQFSIMGNPVRMAVGVDPATSERKLSGGSRTAIIVIAVFPNMDAYLVEARGGRWPVERVLSEIVEINRKWRPSGIWIESVNFQQIFRRLLIKETAVPARDSAAIGDKIARITGTLNPPMANGKILYPDDTDTDTRKDQMAEAVREVIEFPGETMDFTDALEHAYRNVATDRAYAQSAGDVISRAKQAARGRGSTWINTRWD